MEDVKREENRGKATRMERVEVETKGETKREKWQK